MIQETECACPDEIFPTSSQIIQPLEFYQKVLETVDDEQNSNERLLRVQQTDAVVVDVRRPQHYTSIRIEGTTHFAIDDLLDIAKSIEEEIDPTHKQNVRRQVLHER